jgi:hypothetical protein
MTSSTQVPANLFNAKTLDDMIKVVPLLGECDTLEAVLPLAGYDRRATGWLTTVSSWLGFILLSAGLPVLGFYVLIKLAAWLMIVFYPPTDPVISESNMQLIWLLIYLVTITIPALFFNFMGPRRWIVTSTGRLRQRIWLRVLLLKAIRSQLERNQSIVHNHWRGAVCQHCLARYERYRLRFAYWRWLSFARCRKCHSDEKCYPSVMKIQGWLDQGMSVSQEQAGQMVKINMLQRLPPMSLSLPIDLDELVIADVDDENVETLILLYRTEQPRTNLPRPKRLRCRLTRNSTISQMGQRQLQQNFWCVRSMDNAAHIST